MSRVNSERNPKLVDGIINKRAKEYAKKKDEHSTNLRLLNNERLKLIEERQMLEERRREFVTAGSWSSTGKEHLSSLHRRIEAQDLDDLIKSTAQSLTEQAGRLCELRQSYDCRHRNLHMPYNGELGISSYKPWQIPHYHVVRGIVEQIVSGVLDKTFPSNYLNDDATCAFRKEECSRLYEVHNSTSELKAVQLISESFLLQTTGVMLSEVAQEVYFIHSMAHSTTNVSLMKLCEAVATGQDNGRAPEDPLYNLLSQTYLRTAKGRNKYRKDMWGHTLLSHFIGPLGLLPRDSNQEDTGPSALNSDPDINQGQRNRSGPSQSSGDNPSNDLTNARGHSTTQPGPSQS